MKLDFLGNDDGRGNIGQEAAAGEAGQDHKAQANQGGVNVKILADAGANAADHLILIGFIQFLFHCKVHPENSNSCTKVLFSSAA